VSEATIEKSSPAIANTVLRKKNKKKETQKWSIAPLSRGELSIAYIGIKPTRFKQEQDSDER